MRLPPATEVEQLHSDFIDKSNMLFLSKIGSLTIAFRGILGLPDASAKNTWKQSRMTLKFIEVGSLLCSNPAKKKIQKF